MTVFSTTSFLTPVILKVGFAFATTSSDNGEDDGESNTDDATTADDGEDGDSEEQQEDNSEQQQEQEQDVQEGGGGEGQDGAEEEQQLATVIGEVCDDLEDNDGDGLIDLADVEDCAAPLTQGTITAPPPPPPSVINTTAANSTNNTLTAAGITTTPQPQQQQQQESPYIVEVCGNRIDDDGDGLADLDDFEGCAPPSTSSNTRYKTPSGDIVDVTGCTSFEELGLPPPPPRAGLNEPPGLVYFDCDNVTFGLIPLDSSTTPNSGTGGGGQGGQGQQQQQPPPPPPPTTTSQGVEQGPVITDNPDGSKTTTNPDGSWHTTTHPRQCVTITYFSDGRVQTRAGEPIIGTPTCTEAEERTEFPDGREMIRYYNGAFMVKYPDGSKIWTPAGAWRPNLW